MYPISQGATGVKAVSKAIGLSCREKKSPSGPKGSGSARRARQMKERHASAVVQEPAATRSYHMHCIVANSERTETWAGKKWHRKMSSKTSLSILLSSLKLGLPKEQRDFEGKSRGRQRDKPERHAGFSIDLLQQRQEKTVWPLHFDRVQASAAAASVPSSVGPPRPRWQTRTTAGGPLLCWRGQRVSGQPYIQARTDIRVKVGPDALPEREDETEDWVSARVARKRKAKGLRAPHPLTPGSTSSCPSS